MHFGIHQTGHHTARDPTSDVHKHIYHKVHLGDSAVIWIELTNVMVLVADLNGNIGCLIVCDLGIEQVVHYLNHTICSILLKKIHPQLMIQ